MLIIIGKEDGAIWSSSGEDFKAKSYKATVMYEDGTEKDEVLDENKNMLNYVKEFKRPPGGVRFNEKKYMPIRTFKDGALGDNMPTVYLKQGKNGGCLCVTKRSIIITT